MNPDVEQKKQAEEKGKLTREQRRHMERVNKEAHERLERLVNLWFEFFTDHDPESEQVKEKQKEVSAKWKMYCHARSLKPEALKMCDEQCDDLRHQYMEMKNKP